MTTAPVKPVFITHHGARTAQQPARRARPWSLTKRITDALTLRQQQGRRNRLTKWYHQ